MFRQIFKGSEKFLGVVFLKYMFSSEFNVLRLVLAQRKLMVKIKNH